MKKCAYCGKENVQEATRCAECGSEFSALASTTKPSVPWERIAVLTHEVEAERLGIELNNQNIEHVMVSYSDTALDGVYQLSRGWGHVEAPPDSKQTILTILRQIREGNFESSEPPSQDTDAAPNETA